MELVEGIDLAVGTSSRAARCRWPKPWTTSCRPPGGCNTCARLRRGASRRQAVQPAAGRAGNIKVSDFGLARWNFPAGTARPGRRSPHAYRPRAGDRRLYRAEQARSTRSVDRRADIYALGATLHFLLTGHSMFSGESVVDRLIALCEQPAPALADSRSDLPPGLEAVFQKMVAKRPEEHFPSMEEVIAAWRRAARRPASGRPRRPPAGQVAEADPGRRGGGGAGWRGRAAVDHERPTPGRARRCRAGGRRGLLLGRPRWNCAEPRPCGATHSTSSVLARRWPAPSSRTTRPPRSCRRVRPGNSRPSSASSSNIPNPIGPAAHLPITVNAAAPSGWHCSAGRRNNMPTAGSSTALRSVRPRCTSLCWNTASRTPRRPRSSNASYRPVTRSPS